MATIRARSYRVPRGHLLKWSFTLIELLVVISIIALLIALILPALKNARATAQTAVCMSNSRQVTGAATTYVYDNNGWYPRFMATLDNDPDLWKGYTHYWLTLKQYFNDWDVLVDPARKNPGPATSYRNYTMVGHSYLIYDPRVISWGQGLRTRIDDVSIPAKSQLTKCIYYWRANDNLPGLYGKTTLPDRHVEPVG
ncbi:MAG TPA: prepilin-type N-terminal cleavage/methylation domain-containing protein, partial [Gammaproteobacteria bacterium]|nr:prepilin-type N-terminal cleavage/methylation domain-containing protein [Gammaproteobacteria bacterium]